MLPTIEGVMKRRILVNYLADPALIRPLVPKPLELTLQNGSAVVGICLIGLQRLRPKGFPGVLGISSENMAHRVAIRFKENGRWKDGVFIWRRDTDQNLTALLGGRLFPGVHEKATFQVSESPSQISMAVETRRGRGDVALKASYPARWEPSRLFKTFGQAKAFFQKGDCGFSCALQKDRLEGMRLQTLRWEMEPIKITKVHSAFYEKLAQKAPNGIQYDCALLMKGIPHRWNELKNIPELAVQ